MNNKKYNILVTGIGAIIGYGVIKSLRNSYLNVNIIGMDIYKDAVGKYWCDEFIQAKYAVDEDYIKFLNTVIEKFRIDLVFFGTEQEIYRVSNSKEELGENYRKLVVNKLEILELSKDKWKTYQYLLEKGMADMAIPTTIIGTYTDIKEKFGERFMLKPRSSYASKGIEIIDSEEEFEFFKTRMGNNFMAQKLIGDMEHEYTVGVFGLGDGTYSSYIAMKRKLSQEGATAKAEVVDILNLELSVKKLVSELKPIGPTNLQFRYEQGKYFLLEINPRISSSTSIRAALGYNEAAMSIEYFLNQKTQNCLIKMGRATRFIDEVIEIYDRNYS